MDYGSIQAKYQHSSRTFGTRSGRDVLVKIEVDLHLTHPAALSLYPQRKDDESLKRGPPPWMQKPIDPLRTNSGQLIVKAPPAAKRVRSDSGERDERDGVVAHHFPSDKMFRVFLSAQERFVDRPTKRPKLEK